MIVRAVSIEKKHDDFIKDSRQSFSLSKFVRDRLDEYIKFTEGLKDGWLFWCD